MAGKLYRDKPLVVRRTGEVAWDGDVIGEVWGEARNWRFGIPAAPGCQAVTDGPWFTQRSAAEACVDAWRKTQAQPAGGRA